MGYYRVDFSKLTGQKVFVYFSITKALKVMPALGFINAVIFFTFRFVSIVTNDHLFFFSL